MSSSGLLLAFLATSAIFALVPGPAMIYAAGQALARGRWSGLMASLGLHVGGYLHVGTAAAGLSLLFHAVPALYLAVKLAGAAYLIWLGAVLLLGKGRGEAAAAPPQAKSGRRAFLEGIAVEALNPKTAIFFAAFLPQFIDPSAAAPIWLQFLTLGIVVNWMFSTTDVICVLLAGAAVDRLRGSARAQLWVRRAGGAAIVGLGVKLALQER
jgi:threonine/homoserine/homoserine lactone efflux protein